MSNEIEIPAATPEERFVITTSVDGKLVSAQRIADPFLLHTITLTDDVTGEEKRIEVRIDAEWVMQRAVMNQVQFMGDKPLLDIPVGDREPTEGAYAQTEVVQVGS